MMKQFGILFAAAATLLTAGMASAHDRDWDGDGWGRHHHHHDWRRPPAYYYGPPARVYYYNPYYGPRYYRDDYRAWPERGLSYGFSYRDYD